MCCLQKIDEARKAVEEGVKEGESTTLPNKKEGVKKGSALIARLLDTQKELAQKRKITFL